MRLAKAMLTVVGITALFRIAVFLRDILTAAFLGAGPVADAFFVALKIPNLFRRITAEGAFSIVFVPMYSKKMETKTPEIADKFASNAFMVMLSLLSTFTVMAIILMPYIISLIAPGFSNDPQRSVLAVELTRITFPYLPLISLTALLGGVLNAMNRFAPFAFAPVLFNVSLITSLLLSNNFETVGHALSWGLLIAGFFQFSFLLLCARKAGMNLSISVPKLNADIRKVFKLMGPAVVGAGVMHINLFADVIIASFLEKGSISYLYYADRLNQLPLGVVGIAVGTALLPMLSRSMRKKNKDEARNLFNRSLEYCLLLALPASVALFVMPLTLVTVLFERGAFTASNSIMCAEVLRAYVIGLPAYITIKVFSTVHWAREDTVTPVRISIIATIINVILSVILVRFIGVSGIALGTGITGWLQFVLHIKALKNNNIARFDNKIIRNFPRIILASCVMGVGVYILASLLNSTIFYGSLPVRMIVLSGIVICGIASYVGVILVTGVMKLSDLKHYVTKQ